MEDLTPVARTRCRGWGGRGQERDPSEAAEWVAQQLAIAPGQSVTSFLWDVNQALPQLALERDASGAPTRRYVYGLARIRQSVGTAGTVEHGRSDPGPK
jgi:hypothetical protein